MTDHTTSQIKISQLDKAEAFKALHETGTFVMPNFWDIGSAVMLEKLGFQATASTSAGFAQAIGRLDGQISLDEKLTHLSEICSATKAPINADFENGFAHPPAQTAANILRAADAGVVGASIEDWSGSEIYDFNLAVERIAACAEATATLDFPFMLTARAENLLRGIKDLDDTIRRLVAFEAAGADVLYAPGLANAQDIKTVLDALDKPLNVLFVFMPNMTLAEYEALGVRRVSIGGALANYAIGATLNAANAMLDNGDFSWVKDAAPAKVVNNLLG